VYTINREDVMDVKVTPHWITPPNWHHFGEVDRSLRKNFFGVRVENTNKKGVKRLHLACLPDHTLYLHLKKSGKNVCKIYLRYPETEDEAQAETEDTQTVECEVLEGHFEHAPNGAHAAIIRITGRPCDLTKQYAADKRPLNEVPLMEEEVILPVTATMLTGAALGVVTSGLTNIGSSVMSVFSM